MQDSFPEGEGLRRTALGAVPALVPQLPLRIDEIRVLGPGRQRGHGRRVGSHRRVRANQAGDSPGCLRHRQRRNPATQGQRSHFGRQDDVRKRNFSAPAPLPQRKPQLDWNKQVQHAGDSRQYSG